MNADGQIKSYFERWERLEAEKKVIGDDLKELFAEAKGVGFDSRALRAAFRLKVKQDLDSPADAEFEAVVDVYLSALNGSTRDARMRTRENIEEFDPITGEFIEEFRAKAGEGANTMMRAASSDPVSRTDDVRERQHVSTVELADDCRTGGKEHSAAAAAPVGDTGAYAEGIPATNSKSDDDAFAEVKGRARLANADGVEPSSSGQIDPSEDRGEGHSPESVNPTMTTGSLGANAGGDHVTAQPAATHQAEALVKSASAIKPLRPLCRNPGEHCGGYGSTHCGSCLRAAKEAEVAA